MKNLLFFFSMVLICTFSQSFVHAQDVLDVDNGEDRDLYAKGFKTGFTRIINTSLPTGRSLGAHGVSATGAATYTIPLVLPPGTKGMAPNLAINYNSQGGDGTMGLGWAVSGLSSIYRTSKNIYHDQEVDAIQWNSEDPIALDGNRLQLMSGSALSAGAEYNQEVEDFSRIHAVGSGEAGVCFERWTKSGVHYTYGCSPSARKVHPNGETYAWLLERVEDLDGNYYSYEYGDYNGEHVLLRILYTGNESSSPVMAPYWEVEFQYNERFPDKNELFVQGLSIKREALVRRILVREAGGGNVVRSYRLQYNVSYRHSVLRQVTEVGKNGTALNSTIVKYGESGSGNGFSEALNGEDPSTIWLSGDFNGDGLTDLVSFMQSASVPPLYYEYGSCNMLLKGSPGNTFNPLFTHTFSNPQTIVAPNSFVPYKTFDYNGDGMDDIVTIDRGPGSSLQAIRIYESPFSAGGLPNPTDFSNSSPGTLPDLNPDRALIPGDFNGDGRMDFITLHDLGAASQPRLTISGSGTSYVLLADGGTDWKFADYLFVVDFNGDGKSDILLREGTLTKVVTYNEVNGSWQPEVLYSYSQLSQEYEAVHPADFNGDGRTDLLIYDGNFWRVLYSTGTGFVTTTLPWHIVSGNPETTLVLTGDFDGDGLSDFMECKNESGNITSTVKIFASTGNSFSLSTHVSGLDYDPPWFVDWDSYIQIDPLLPYIPGDFDGDGKLDLIFRDRENIAGPMKMIHRARAGSPRLAVEIVDGFGHNTVFNYAPLAHGSHYSKGTALNFPLNKTEAPIYVVKHTTVPDGVNPINTTTDDLITYYEYSGATVHRGGRGFLGFESVKSWTSLDPALISSSFFTVDPSSYLFYPIQETLERYESIINEVDYVQTYQPLSNGRWWLKRDKMDVHDHVNAATNTTTYSYDPNGNVTNESTLIGQALGGGANWQHASSLSSTYGSFHTLSRPGKVLTVNRLENRSGQPIVSKSTQYSYLNNGWRLSTVTDWAGTAKEVATTFSNYNDFGLPEQKSLQSTGLPTITNQSIYDAFGRYVEQTINTEGQTETMIHDPASGRVLSHTNIGQLTEVFTYDEFHRLASHTDALLNTQNVSYHWDGLTGAGTSTTTAPNVTYHTTTSGPGSPDVEVYYDMFQRERMTKSKGFAGQDLTTITSYDKYGSVKTTTLPFSDPLSAEVTTYQYGDWLLRLTQVNNVGGGSGETEVYNYSNSIGNTVSSRHKKVSITRGQITIKKTTDMAGMVVRSQDNGSELLFTYDSWGNTVKVSNGQDDLTTMEYDNWGRQTKLTDYSAGQTLYSYNAYGQLESETDAMNNVRTFAYDNLGRLISETGPEGMTTRTYVATGNGLNQLQSVSGFNGISKSYTYDSYHRLETETSNLAFPMTKTYHYDGLGRMTKQDYSTGFSIEHQYNANGFLSKVLYFDGSAWSILAEATSASDLGQYTEFDLSNGLSSEIEYNSHGMPTRYHTAGVQDLEMDWNMADRNLSSRTDNMLNYTESFSYDGLKRLKNAVVNGNGSSGIPLANPMASNGDVEGKFDAGSEYSYYGQFQVKQVKNDNWEIPADNQTLTYTAFNEPDEISEGGNSVEFVYGPGKQRIQARFYENGSSAIAELRHYLPEMGYEVVQKNGQDHHMHYVPLFGNTMAIVLHEPGSETPESVKYVYKDHLGSWLKVTNDEGAIVARQNFDAWGRRREPDTWLYGNTTQPVWLIRGYTAHEHLDRFDIIHMNGRLYDPVMGRMFQADNFVQNPYFSQSYNRYSYVLNNPLKYTDPSGELTKYDVAAGASIVAGALLMGFVPGGQATGASLIMSGTRHFASSAALTQEGSSWNEASNFAGITFSHQQTVALTTGPNRDINAKQAGATGIYYSAVDAVRGYEKNYFSFSVGHPDWGTSRRDPFESSDTYYPEGGPMMASSDPMFGSIKMQQSSTGYVYMRFSNTFQAINPVSGKVRHTYSDRSYMEFNTNNRVPNQMFTIQPDGGVTIHRTVYLNQSIGIDFNSGNSGLPLDYNNKFYFRAWQTGPNNQGSWIYGWFWRNDGYDKTIIESP